MPVPSYPEFERFLMALRDHADARFREGVESAFGSAIENLANGDDVVFAFKWLCNDIEQLAHDGYPITPDFYRQIEEVGRSVAAPPGQWKILAPYVK